LHESCVHNTCIASFGLQAASYDARHSIITLCRLARHEAVVAGRPLHLHVYEEDAEGLARHLLLLSVLLDGSLLARDRMETLLELHSNALLRDQTAAYLGEQVFSVASKHSVTATQESLGSALLATG
jgi:hypothetical protein